jgi:hypothetical protein
MPKYTLYNKIENKKYHIVGTILKSNKIITETGNIHTLNIHIYSWLSLSRTRLTRISGRVDLRQHVLIMIPSLFCCLHLHLKINDKINICIYQNSFHIHICDCVVNFIFNLSIEKYTEYRSRWIILVVSGKRIQTLLK